MFSVLSCRVSKALRLLGQTVEVLIFDCLALKMKALQSFETLMSVYQWMPCNVPEYWNMLCINNTAVRILVDAVYQALYLCHFGCQ